MSTTKYLSPREAANRLGLSYATVMRLAQAGKIKGAKPPQPEWQIPEKALDSIPVRGKGRPRVNTPHAPERPMPQVSPNGDSRDPDCR